MTKQQTLRLSHIRKQLKSWNTTTDTSTWDAAFFLGILDEKDQEIARLRRNQALFDKISKLVTTS